MPGIEQTTQAIDGLFTIAAAVKRAIADGFAADDVFGAMADGPTKNALYQAYDGLAQVPAEMRELDGSEMVSLLMHMMSRAGDLF